MKKTTSRADTSVTTFSHILLAIASFLCLFPFVLLIAASLTAESAITSFGYQLIPTRWSLEAYQYILNRVQTIGRAYGITFLVTIVGTIMSITVTSLLAYTLSQRTLPGKKVLTFLVVFTMLFGGGLVPSYLWYVNYLHIKNTIWALLIPGLLTNGFIIMIATNYFRVNVPEAVVESARIDGAGEFKIFYSIVLPFSTPIIASIGLMQGLMYWNDWRNGLYYITSTKLYSIQNILNRMIQEVQYLATSDLASYATEAVGSFPSASLRMAIAVIAALPIMVLYPFFQKFFAKGLTIGSVKG